MAIVGLPASPVWHNKVQVYPGYLASFQNSIYSIEFRHCGTYRDATATAPDESLNRCGLAFLLRQMREAQTFALDSDAELV